MKVVFGSLIRHLPRTVLILMLVPVMISFSLFLSACDNGNDNGTDTKAFNLNSALGGIAEEGFARAAKPREFLFPRDHSMHPDFRNEWWYVTGNLQTADGQRFGYQVTFFRIAMSPADPDVAESDVTQPAGVSWATRQLWMAHVALTDITGEQHFHDQRFARGAAGLAGQTDQPFRVWLEDWQLVGGRNAEFPWAITVAAADFRLNLQLSPQKPIILQGDAGLSQKSTGAGNASYYYSLTRLDTVGEIYLGQQRFVAKGLSWLDREWSTSVLGDDQVGWDWFSLQFDKGEEVMLYQLRTSSGEADENSAGKWISATGQAETLNMEKVKFKSLRPWCRIQKESACYPVKWKISLPAKGLQLIVTAVVDDQLMEAGITYWEGAVQVADAQTGELLGRGYLEMSGYE